MLTNEELRSIQDKKLFDLLLQDSTVQKVNQGIERQEKQGPLGTRRQLLATSVRLSEKMAPRLARIAQECIEKLGVLIPVELYAYSSPQYNAACVKPEEGRLFIMFSSSLLDAFDDDELRFVVGHELGHFIYNHHSIPIGYILRGRSRPSPDLALTLTSWSRYAEISADRAGAHCTNDFHTVARSLFKLASGVTSSIVQFDLKEFINQVNDMQIEDGIPGANSSSQDWFLTHPFSPLRVKALQLFHKSELAKKDGILYEELEMGVEGLMTLMEPSYFDAHTDVAKAMRHFCFASILLIANSDEHISQEEIRIFEQFFGKHQYSENFNLEKLERDLPQRSQQVLNLASLPKRMQIVRDLCVMAKAENHTKTNELNKLIQVAALIEVPELFVRQCLNNNDDLD